MFCKAVKILFILGILFTGYILFEPYWVKLKKIEIVDADIPDEFINKKIIFIADIHHGPFFKIDRAKKIVKKINKLNPDIILLGGDYVHRDKKYIEPLFSVLKNLKAKYFIGGVLGNHDHWESKKITYENMKEANINILDNRSYWIKIDNKRIKIGGVGDLWEDKQIVKNTISDVLDTDFVILVSHNPDYFKSIKNNKIDLMLSGHSHGGQVTFFGIWAPVLPIKFKKYWKGYFLNKVSSLYVTTGIGTITPPVRFFSRPEIVEITLKNR